MAKAWVPYVVQQGDHLDKLAFKVGVSADDIWSHPSNASLAANRPQRNMLCTGDVLSLPAEPAPALPFALGAVNRYAAKVPTVTVTLRLGPSKKEPQSTGAKNSARFANQPFVVEGIAGDKDVLEGTSDAEGTVNFEVPVLVREVTLRFPKLGVRIPVNVGDLDPIQEPSGVAQRLRHLGYLPPSGDVSPATVAEAIKSFKAAHGLPSNADLDDATRDALVEAHLS